MGQIPAAIVSKLLSTSFDLGELRILCLDMGITFEDVTSNNHNKFRAAQDITLYYFRRGQEQELLTEIARKRPNLLDKVNEVAAILNTTTIKASPQPHIPVEVTPREETPVKVILGQVDDAISLLNSIRDNLRMM